MAKATSEQLEVITVWPNGQTFAQDGSPQYDILKIDDNAVVTFLNGITFNSRCNRLIMGKNVKIVATGTNGSDGSTPPKVPDIWCSGTPAQHQAIVHPGFLVYAAGTDGSNPRYPYRSIGYQASSPTRGGSGAKVTISYHHYEGYAFDKLKQAFINGGRGGKGARGGEGATVHCTINPCGGVLQAPSGVGSSDASDGSQGSFDLIEYQPRKRRAKHRKKKKAKG